MITINEGQQNGNTIVYAMVEDERINLREFDFGDTSIKAFKEGAEAVINEIGVFNESLSPEQVAEMAQEAARAAGVDESIIAQGGVAVGPWGAVSISSDLLTTGHEDESDLDHDDDEGPVYE